MPAGGPGSPTHPHRSRYRLRMAAVRLDHLYRETHSWDESTAWWTALGYALVDTWGTEPYRAGILSRDRMRIVLAEVPGANEPGESVFVATDDLDDIATRSGCDVIDTHWGTVMVTDPDGRTYNFEPGGDG